MTRRDWADGELRSVGLFLNGDEIPSRTRQGEHITDESFLLLFNAFFEELSFRLPARRFGTRWELVLATGGVEGERLVPGADVTIESRSVAVFRRVA
jgi:glycogen operon protein